MLISTALAVVLGRAHRSLLDRLIVLLPKLGLPAWDELVPPAGLLFDALKDIELHRGGSLQYRGSYRTWQTCFPSNPFADAIGRSPYPVAKLH